MSYLVSVYYRHWERKVHTIPNNGAGDAGAPVYRDEEIERLIPKQTGNSPRTVIPRDGWGFEWRPREGVGPTRREVKPSALNLDMTKKRLGTKGRRCGTEESPG